MFARVSVTLLAVALSATGQTAPPAFDVASVKPSAISGRIRFSGGPGTADPERITYENVDLKRLLVKAWGIEIDQITGPAWLDSEKYTIAAKLPPGTTQDQFQLMLQHLLTERFRLTLHHEAKEFTVYELTVAKNGPKFTAAAPLNPNDSGPDQLQPGEIRPATMELDKEGCPAVRPGVSSGSATFGPGATCSRFTKTTMPKFAESISHFVSMADGTFGTAAVHVIDKTGRTGDFDLTLKFHMVVRFPGQARPVEAQASEPDGMDGPSLETALEQQLGLKLQMTKATLGRIVIDSADRVPLDN